MIQSSDSGAAGLSLPAQAVALLASKPLAARRAQLPAVPCSRMPDTLRETVAAVNNGAGLWAAKGGEIGDSEIRALVVNRPPSPEEVGVGAAPEAVITRRGYEALAMLFEHASLDVQMELYRRLDRSRPWWAWLDVFGWFRGARAPVERFEEEYDPSGPVETMVLGHDRGRWFLPSVFRRWFDFTVGKGDWTLGLREIVGRGGDVEAEEPTARGYAPALIHQYEEMEPAHRWRALCAMSPRLLDSALGARLAAIEPTWFDRGRFGVAFVSDPDDPARGERLRSVIEEARTFLLERMQLNPYAVEAGFDASYVPVSKRYPEIPSEPIHQFAVELRARLAEEDSGTIDVVEFGEFQRARYPTWPQLVPGQLHTVREQGDQLRFLERRVDLWGVAGEVRTRDYTVAKTLHHHTTEVVGHDKDGRPITRSKSSTWVARVPCVRIDFAVRGESGRTSEAIWEREGGATAVGHYVHVTHEPDRPDLAEGVTCFAGKLDGELRLHM